MKRIRLILCFIALFFIGTTYAQTEKMKALFIYSFTNYIDWPRGPHDVFVITVLGDTPVQSELEANSQLKKVNGTMIEVKKVVSVAEIGYTNIIFVPSSKKQLMSAIGSALAGKNVLIVSDGATSDFGINFVMVNQKLSFQVSKSRIQAHNLKVNSQLLSLGIAVN